MRAILCFAAILCVGNTFAMGNYPEANTCSQHKPYYAVCTAGSHDLQGWVGTCYASREEAQKEADEHAQKLHAGVSQWTGVTRISRTAKYRNSGLPP
ncbi:MAG: hypothetical protein HY273_07950 [Gammaproteobacteria bacterium]|nr:hypothetical protein [Gammaproteobacteria bacterium]